jgi:signal transduction histidine kinase
MIGMLPRLEQPSPELTLCGLWVGIPTVVWAATGAGYFWPMWAWLGLAMLVGATAIVRWAPLQPPGARRRLEVHALLSGLVGTCLVLIWAMAGFGYFWPVFPLVGLGALVAVHQTLASPERDELEVRVDQLTRTRSGALDVQAAELRRIERDLHDGAQARLVALSLQLGRAEERLTDSPEVAELVRQARQEAAAAIAELRDLARGIAPPVLADRGLAAAVRSLADRSPLRVDVAAHLDERLPPVVETAAYFVVAEALTNAAKHAPGAEARVVVEERDGALAVTVSDTGPGGADPAGSGLTGLRQRAEALDGALWIVSAPGTGTTVEAVIPCGS